MLDGAIAKISIAANDFDFALRIVTADPLALESPDAIPPPLECCGDAGFRTPTIFFKVDSGRGSGEYGHAL